jgi:hypothetical protein
MLKNLLVHIPSERPIRPVVDGAISLAVSRAAHLDAVSIGYEATSVDLATDGAAAVATVFEIDRERALARAPRSWCLKPKPGAHVSATASGDLQASQPNRQQP